MSHPKLLKTRARAAGVATLAAASLLLTSFTPFNGSVAADNTSASETTQATSASETENTSDASASASEQTAASNSQTPVAGGTEANTSDTSAQDADTSAEANQPRSRRARATSSKPATLAMSVSNDSATLPIRDQQITTINYSCSSVSTPCEGGTIEVWLPGPVTPAGEQLSTSFYQTYPVTGDTVVKTQNNVVSGTPRMQRLLFTLKNSIPAGTSDRIQIPWSYFANDVPNNSTTTTRIVFSATNADPIEQSLTTKWTADLDVAIEKTGPTRQQDYPAVGGLATYKLYYGYQQIDQTNPNKPGIRWNGSARKSANLNGLNFVQAQNIKVSDPLPANAEFVSATNGGVYDAATHTVNWTYANWAWQNPITSTVTVKYPAGSVTTADTVTNKATITAEAQNDPTTVVTKSSQITHGFSESKPAASMIKLGNDNQYQTRGGSAQWRLGASNSGNTTLHFHWDDTLPCTWSTQDAKAAGTPCDQPTMVSPYRFSIFSNSGFENNGGWTLEYWTNKGNHASVNYTASSNLTLPEGEWITRYTIDTDALPQTSPNIFFYGTIPTNFPTEEPADFASHYNPVAPPERYYNYVASSDYVRYQNCASGTATDIETGRVIFSNDNLCSWMRVRNNYPSVHITKSIATNPVVIGKPALFFLQGNVRPKNDGGVPTPFTMTDLLPAGFDVDDASAVGVGKTSRLQTADGTAYDLSKVTVSIEKNYNGTGRTLVRITVPDAVEGVLYAYLTTNVLSTAPAGQNTNDGMIFMPGDGAKSVTEDKSLRNTSYCWAGRTQDTFDVNGNGSTTDYVCNSSSTFNVAVTPAMNITKEVKGNKDTDFVPAGQVAQIDPGADGAYRFTITNAGNAALTKVVAYDVLPYKGDVGVGPAASQARGSSWRPQLNSTNWSFQSIKQLPGQAPVTTAVPSSDITVEYTTAENPCRGEVMSAGGAMNSGPSGCTPNAWGAAPADLSTITGFRIVMNRDIEIGEKIQFIATMTSPVNANLIAWNSVALSGGVVENGKVSYLQPNEAPKVGINVSTDVAVEKSVARVKMNGDQVVRDANGLPETVDSTGPAMPGDYMLYKVNLKNNGPAVASGLSVKDSLPSGVEYVSSEARICQTAGATPCANATPVTGADYDPTNSTWQAVASGDPDVTLNVGGTETLYVLVKVKDGTAGTTISNTASLSEFDQIDSNPANNTSTATFTVGGALSGTIFNDTDATWANDPGIDKPFEGVTLRLLDGDGNPVKDAAGADITTTTDASGNYTFTHLPLGSYKVEVVPGNVTLNGDTVALSDYTQTLAYGSSASRTDAGKGKLTTPTAITLTAAAPTASKIDFGFVKPASIGDYVWFDANKDGIQDADEYGVAGVRVTLVDSLGNPVVDANGNTVAAVTTDANGKYTFENLLPNPERMLAQNGNDSYTVRFTPPAGYTGTISNAGTDADTDSNGPTPKVTLTQGQKDMSIDFGLISNGYIGDTIFWDVDNNGGSAPSGADKPLAGVTVTLTYTTPAGVQKTLTTTTDANGKYKFENLAPGDYKVTVDQASLTTACPVCTAQTHAPSGNLTPSENQTLSLSSKVTLSPGKMSNDSQDWAFTGPANTAIVKTITDPAAEPAGGFTPGTTVTYTITLTNEGPNPATGVIAQDKLPTGVTFVSSTGDGSYDATTGKWDLSDEVIEKDATRTRTIVVRVTPEAAGSIVTNTATIEHQDQFGDKTTDNTSSVPLTAGYTIAGKLYNDANASFSSDNGENPYSGVTIALLKKDGTPVLDKDGNPVTTVTDADGKYSFTGLPLGEYKVDVVNPTSGPLAGTKPLEAYTGRYKTSAEVTIKAETGSVIDVNFGFVKPASLGDYTWMDVNRDGIQDADEPALPGVTVTLTYADGSAVTDASGNAVTAKTSDANGKYKFENLLPGDYKVSFQAPAGYEATTSDAGSDRALDSNGATASVTLAQDQTDETIDFGAVGTGVIGDQLFLDVNQNGGNAPDAGDKVLPGVKVTLTWTGPGGITRTYETTTDADGKYKFENLLPGDYKVSVDPETLQTAEPLLDVLTHSPAGDVENKTVLSDTTKADSTAFATAMKLTANLTLTGEKNQNLDQDWGFGISADTAIKKAITDPNEVDQETFEFTPGKKVTYTLTLSNNGPGVATGVTVSDKLPAGVKFVKAEGDGTYDATTGVWNLSGETIAKGDDQSIEITVEITGEGAGALVTNVARISHQDQAGDNPTNNESSASFKGGYNLGGTIYRDSDASFSKSSTEERFAGVTVALLDGDGNPVLDHDGNPMTTVTDADGNYQFVALGVGTYRVSIVDPNTGVLAGLTNTQAYTGRGATQAPVTITDSSVQGVDFGFVKPATIGDRVWNDQDHNGVDNGEPGVPGVTVILKDASGTEVARTTTDSDGRYRFEGVLPGTYTVSIEVPSGYEAASTSTSVTLTEGEVNLDIDFPVTLIPTPSQPAKSLLAKTGADAQWIAILTAMLLTAGVGALGTARKRRN